MALIDRLVEGPQAWRGLGHARRKDVLHHARQGRPYPDPEVAAIAVQWARRVRSKPLWWRLLRGVGMAVVVYSAVGGVIAAGIWALPDSTTEMEHGLWPVLRTAWQLAPLTLMFGLWPWWDAGRILGLHDRSAEPDGPGAGGSR
jgi:hypothetical protein